MTNREWLNTLSNEDFVKWCFDEEVIDFETLKSEYHGFFLTECI